jgi:hypothetical protein
MKASNLIRATTINMHWTFVYLGHAVSMPVFYYSLQLNVRDVTNSNFNAMQNVLLEPGGGGGGFWPRLLFYTNWSGPKRL